MQCIYICITSQNPEVIRLLVTLNLSTIYNCSQVTSIEIYFLSPEFDCILIFERYLTSPYLEVCLHARFILSCLTTLLSEKEVDQLLQLTSEEQDSFLKALQISTTANDREVKCNAFSFSVTEALKSLNNLAMNIENCEMIIESNLVPSLAAVLISGNISEQKAVCELVWNVLRRPTVGSKFKVLLGSSVISIEDCVSPLLKSGDEELVILAESVLFSMDTPESEGTGS